MIPAITETPTMQEKVHRGRRAVKLFLLLLYSNQTPGKQPIIDQVHFTREF